LRTPHLQDRTPRRAIPLAVMPAAVPYRASGLVLWVLFGLGAMSDLSPYALQNGHRREQHSGLFKGVKLNSRASDVEPKRDDVSSLTRLSRLWSSSSVRFAPRQSAFYCNRNSILKPIAVPATNRTGHEECLFLNLENEDTNTRDFQEMALPQVCQIAI
jgi:hypothetical protein